jgi:hypothetical protein
MKKVLIPVFKFEELSDEVKASVRQKEYEFLSEMGDIAEQVKDFYSYRLQEMNYPVDDIRWSLSYCQGDGMAFYGHLDIDTLVKLRNRLMPGKGRSLPVTFFEEYIDITITCSNNHYDHYNTMHLSMDICHDITSAKRLDALKEFVGLIAEDMKETSKLLEREGYNLIEAMQESEYLDECIVSQDRDYYIDGEILSHTYETCLECA